MLGCASASCRVVEQYGGRYHGKSLDKDLCIVSGIKSKNKAYVGVRTNDLWLRSPFVQPT